jgi:hypothetical protein
MMRKKEKMTANVDGEKLKERADKLADALIESLGYTDSQLVCRLTLDKIIKKLCQDRLNGSKPEG